MKNWTSAVFAEDQGLKQEPAIALAMWRTSAAYAEGLALLRQHAIVLATWSMNVASVAVMDQLVRRAARMQVPATMILQPSSTTVPAQNLMNVAYAEEMESQKEPVIVKATSKMNAGYVVAQVRSTIVDVKTS